MNQMIEAWKQVPDIFDEVSTPPESHCSSKGMFFTFMIEKP